MPVFHFPKNNRKRIYLKCIIANFLVIIFASNNALADPAFKRMEYPTNFSLSFSYANLDLEENNTTFKVNQRRISASILNPVNPYIDIGLILGSSYLGLDNDPLTTGIDLNGNHIGFLIMGDVGTNTLLKYRAYYLYQDAKGSNTLRSATLTWIEWLTEASVNIGIGSSWALNLGAGLLGIEARRRVKGDINNTLTLQHHADFQGRFSVDIYTDPGGEISINIVRRAQNGASLSFSRDF